MISALRKAAQADRESPQAEWRLIHRIADAALPAAARAISRALLMPERDTTWTKFVDALKSGDAESAASTLDLEAQAKGLHSKVWPLIYATYVRAAQITLRQASRGAYRVEKARAKAAPKPERMGLSIAFKETNPYAKAWAEQHAGTLITEVTTETRKAVRAVIGASFRDQVTPRDTAKRVRQIVGLTERSAVAVQGLRERLEASGLKAESIERRVSFVAAKALRERSMLIARTEIMGASNAGQLQAWRQGRSDGVVDSDLVKEWIVTPDDRLCPTCEPLDGVQVDMDSDFPGAGSNPPLHPACRCAIGLVAPKGKK